MGLGLGWANRDGGVSAFDLCTVCPHHEKEGRPVIVLAGTRGRRVNEVMMIAGIAHSNPARHIGG